MTWLEEAKRRAERLCDIRLPYDCDIYAKATSQIAEVDAPRAYALLTRAAELIRHLREPAMLAGLKISVDACDSFLRDLEGKEVRDAQEDVRD